MFNFYTGFTVSTNPMIWLLYLLSGLGLILVISGITWGIKSLLFSARATRTLGIVVDNALDDESSYFPIVEVSLPGLPPYRFTSSIGNGRPRYTIGTKVKVAYTPNRPEKARLYSFPELYMLPIVLVFTGSLLASLSLLLFLQ